MNAAMLSIRHQARRQKLAYHGMLMPKDDLIVDRRHCVNGRAMRELRRMKPSTRCNRHYEYGFIHRYHIESTGSFNGAEAMSAD